MALVLVVMSVRMYVRLFMSRKIGLDDVLMFIGTVPTFGLSIASIIAATYGVGLHAADIPPPREHTPHAPINLFHSTPLQSWHELCQSGPPLFYLRLDPRRPMRLGLYIFTGIIVAFNITSFFIVVFSCNPPAMFWGDVVAGGKCMRAESQLAFYNANGILNIITDLGIYLVPIPMVWAIKMPFKQKLGVVSIFVLGLLNVAAGCIRFAYVLLLSNTADQYYFLTDALDWCGTELYVAIMCSCATTFKALKKYFPRVFGSTGASSGGKTFSRPSGSRSFGTKATKDTGHPSGSPHWTKLPSTKRVIVSGSARTSNDSEVEMVHGEIVRKTEIHMEYSQENTSAGNGKGLEYIIYVCVCVS